MIALRESVIALLSASAMAFASAQPASSGGDPMSSASAALPAIPYKQDRATTVDATGLVLGALLVCLLIGGGVIYVLARWQRATGQVVRGQRLQVLETRRLGAKASMTLVRWDQEELLLVQGDGPVHVVARAPIGATSALPPGASP